MIFASITEAEEFHAQVSVGSKQCVKNNLIKLPILCSVQNFLHSIYFSLPSMSGKSIFLITVLG